MANFNLGLTQDLAESDTANAEFNWVMVTTTAGSLIIGTAGGDEITLASVPVGVWIPVGEATHVKIASTAVGLMVV
jgi:hypothetical protein